MRDRIEIGKLLSKEYRMNHPDMIVLELLFDIRDLLITKREKIEFNLGSAYEEGFEMGRTQYKKEVKKLKKRLKKVADENDMEIAIDDGEKDGFRVIDFSEYIEKEFSLLSKLEDDEVKEWENI